MNYEDNPKSIKYYVKRYILRHKKKFKDKVVIDLPAGNGITSRIVQEAGGTPVPFDLFPEYFQTKGISCQRANIMEGIPFDGSAADYVICQEGIEHFSDQFKAFKEFNRVLKKNGSLIVTTPNYSNLRAKLSYFLSECERYNKIMPPNELDSVWMNKQQLTSEIYFGHVFLVGIQKLRVLAKLAGFRIQHIEFTRARPTSVLLLPFVYPFIYLSSLANLRRNMRKNKNYDKATKEKVYQEQFKLNINPKILVDGHLFIVFEKEKEVDEVSKNLKSKHKDFSLT